MNKIFPTIKQVSNTVIYCLIAIILLGGFLRYAYLREIAEEPEFSHPSIDGAYHDYWARGLAGEGCMVPMGWPDSFIRERPFFRSPGYPYFLGAVYRVFGGDYLAPRIVQMAIGLLSILVAFLFARRWYGDRVALIFAGLTSFYWTFIYFEGELLGVSLAVFLSLLLFVASSSWITGFGFGRGLLTGLILGVFALFRPNLLVFAPVLAVWAVHLRRTVSPEGRLSLLLVGFFLGIVLAVSPATVRNWYVAGEPVLISSQGGMSLLIGNNTEADGSNHHLPGYGKFSSPFDYPSAVRKMERNLNMERGTLTYSAVSRRYARQALEFILHHPVRFFRLLARKSALFWGPAEVTNNREMETVRRKSGVLGNIPLGFSFCSALFAVGFLMVFFQGRNGTRYSPAGEVSIMVFLFILVYFLSILPFTAAARYRLPVLPGLLLFASIASSRLVSFLQNRRFAPLALWGTVTVILLVLASFNLAGYRSSPAKWYYDRGVAYSAEGVPSRAKAEYRRALELEPGYVQAHINLGALLLEEGEVEAAITHYRVAGELEPDRAEVLSNLGDALSRKGDLDGAVSCFRKALELDPECVPAHNNLGTVLTRQGKNEEALHHYRQALLIRPHYAEAHYNLGLLLSELGKPDAAIDEYREALRFNSSGPMIHNNLGNALALRGDYNRAIVHLSEALELDPDLAEAHNNLANILAFRKDYQKAISHYREALRIEPDYGEAGYNLGYTLDLMGEKEAAVGEYRHSIRIDPLNAPAHYRLALILLKDNQEAEAVQHLRRALAIRPDFKEARRTLDNI